VRQSLVAALTACAEMPLRRKARRFLSGLSFDELEFIAGFFGGWILEANVSCEAPPAFQRASVFGSGLPAADLAHKLILVNEYLCQAGMPHLAGQ
jgi:hypothetical protein